MNMKLKLVRRYNCDGAALQGNVERQGYCIGSLYIDGLYYCDTIEDKDRGLDQKMDLKTITNKKLKGITAIPTGIYRIAMNIQSPRLSKKAQYNFCKGYVPRLLDVKGFDGVLIHIGNTAEDSLGCILVGQNKVKGQVINSTATFKKLYAIMKEAYDSKEDITLEIQRSYKA